VKRSWRTVPQEKSFFFPSGGKGVGHFEEGKTHPPARTPGKGLRNTFQSKGATIPQKKKLFLIKGRSRLPRRGNGLAVYRKRKKKKGRHPLEKRPPSDPLDRGKVADHMLGSSRRCLKRKRNPKRPISASISHTGGKGGRKKGKACLTAKEKKIRTEGSSEKNRDPSYPHKAVVLRGKRHRKKKRTKKKTLGKL